jgi:hypothetical protein
VNIPLIGQQKTAPPPVAIGVTTDGGVHVIVQTAMNGVMFLNVPMDIQYAETVFLVQFLQALESAKAVRAAVTPANGMRVAT